MNNVSVWPIISLIVGLVIGAVALIITVVVMIRSKKYLVPLVIYSIFLLISLVLIGIFVFSFGDTTTDVANENSNINQGNYNTNLSQIKSNANSSSPKTNTNSSLNLNVASNLNVPIEVDPSENDLITLAEEGKWYNSDYSFIIEVGQSHISKMTEVSIEPFDGVTDTYLYCYETSQTEFASWDCGEDAVEVFRINVYTSEEWEAVADSPFVGTVIDDTTGYVYEFTHPNGLLPTDVPANDEFYNTVVSSFHFAG